jgi:glutamate transport system substrate-binding protein
MAKLQSAQKITIGTKFDQPLFGLKGLDGKPAGFDVEIGKIIAAELGIAADKIAWVETPSAVREDKIEKGEVDIVVATYTINDKRKERVDFAGPVLHRGPDDPGQGQRHHHHRPRLVQGRHQEGLLGAGLHAGREHREVPEGQGDQLVLFDVYSKCLDALKGGQVDAITTDNVILTGYMSTNPNQFKLVGTTFTEEPYGIGLKKGDKEFRTFLNDLLEKIFKDGRYVKAWKDTAGKFDEKDPKTPTVNRY